MTREIPATKGFVILVDDEDYERVSSYKWYAHHSSGKYRPARRDSTPPRKVHHLVHAIVRAPDGMVVDHINGDPWDNRRSNLRICTYAENARNSRKRKIGFCEYKGVFPMASSFRALITRDGDRYWLGSYPTAEAAARAYDDAALFLHGQFACLNFDDGAASARDPAEIWAAARKPMTDRHGEWKRRLEAGERALSIAKQFGVAASSVCVFAKRQGISLKRGRSRLGKPESAAA